MMLDSSALRPLTFASIATPLGGLTLAVDADGALCMAEFSDCEHRMERWLRKRGIQGEKRVVLPASAEIEMAFAAYFAGDLSTLDTIRIGLDGTPFQNRAWTELRRIEPGQTFSYGAFAEQLGKPRSARAVGHANGANPLSIVVPCHRLVGADGALTNYGGGIERKRWLLDHERRHSVRH